MRMARSSRTCGGLLAVHVSSVAALFLLLLLNSRQISATGSGGVASGSGGLGACLPEDMARCTDPLRVVTDNKDLGFATSREELDKMCPKLMDGLRCIDDFTYRCLDREHRDYFNTLYQGTTQVIIDLCQEGPYQKDYLRHAPCMRRVQTGYEHCADDYQVRIKSLNSQQQKKKQQRQQRREEEQQQQQRRAFDTENYDEDAVGEYEDAASLQQASAEEAEEEAENVQLLCCSFQQYLHCSESVVNRTCGHETARFTKNFLDRMSGPLIQGHCQAYERGSQGCLSRRSGLAGGDGDGDSYPYHNQAQPSHNDHHPYTAGAGVALVGTLPALALPLIIAALARCGSVY